MDSDSELANSKYLNRLGGDLPLYLQDIKENAFNLFQEVRSTAKGDI